jgi:hypothetical protein
MHENPVEQNTPDVNDEPARIKSKKKKIERRLIKFK